MSDTLASIATKSKKLTTQGVHHLGLTVNDVEETAAFFIDYLGYELVAKKETYPAIFISDGHTLITLWQVQNTEEVIEFDRKNNIGLHHFAIKLESVEQLHEAHQLFIERGINIEFPPEPLGDSGATHMMFYLPNGPRVELIA